MNKGVKLLLYITGFLLVMVAIGVTLTIGWRPILGARSRPLTDRHFDMTPARLARGEYLARGVLGCLDCHTEHDWKAPGGALVPGREGAGQIFPGEGFPGRIVATNLTPDPQTGAGKWTDDQFARAIREGIGHDERTLFPLMPYPNFRHMSDEEKPQREHLRVPIELKVEYKRLNTFFADYTKNISRGGTFIKTTRPLPVGTEFLFKLLVPGRDQPLTIHGEVQRIIDETAQDDAGMAIKFVYREGDPQVEIARVVEGMMTESLGPRLYAKLMDHAHKRRG